MVNNVYLVNSSSNPLTLYQDNTKFYSTVLVGQNIGIPIFIGSVLSVVSGKNLAVVNVAKLVPLGGISTITIIIADDITLYTATPASQSIVVGMTDMKVLSTVETSQTGPNVYVSVATSKYLSYLGPIPTKTAAKAFGLGKLQPAPLSSPTTTNWILIIIIAIVFLVVGLILGMVIQKKKTDSR